MSPRLAHIWRHPIKGIGAEALSSASLAPGRPLPGDRAWAMLRAGQSDTGGWQRCTNFLRGATGPSLMAVDAITTKGGLDLSHPDKAPLSFDPERESDRLIAWLEGLWPADKPGPAGLVKAPPEGMSDVDYPSISILGHASLAALAEAVGAPLDMRRFRGNLWLEGLAPWEEFSWVGRRLAIGSAVLEIVERNTRCRATEANPETGLRDAETLKALKTNWGHQDFGVYAKVIEGGEISLGDDAVLL